MPEPSAALVWKTHPGKITSTLKMQLVTLRQPQLSTEQTRPAEDQLAKNCLREAASPQIVKLGCGHSNVI